MPLPARVPYPDHPDRCQGYESGPQQKDGTRHEGQCWYPKVEGSDFCIMHAGGKTALRPIQESLNLYRIQKYNRRLVELKSANGTRTLDEELAILRMVLEDTLNKCEGDMDIQLYSGKISEIIREIKSVVVAADKMATKAGMLIGRTEAVIIASKVVEIISRHVIDSITLGKISEEILEVFVETTNE